MHECLRNERTAMEKVSKSLEDYLEAMVILGGTTERAIRPSDIARHMDVSKPSVGKALSSLREKGFVDQPYYGEATLTEKGYEYGRAIYRRHRYLTAFFEHELGIPAETAEREACLMEHAISDESFEKWVAFISERIDIEDI